MVCEKMRKKRKFARKYHSTHLNRSVALEELKRELHLRVTIGLGSVAAIEAARNVTCMVLGPCGDAFKGELSAVRFASEIVRIDDRKDLSSEVAWFAGNIRNKTLCPIEVYQLLVHFFT